MRDLKPSTSVAVNWGDPEWEPNHEHYSSSHSETLRRTMGR
jgi:hypothetical protein